MNGRFLSLLPKCESSCDEGFFQAAECRPIAEIEAAADAGLVKAFVMEKGAKVIVKGLRAVSDFEYEFQMALLNRRLEPEVETIFLMTAAEHSYLSSSIVKEIARLGGDITGLVPEAVRTALENKLGNKLGRQEPGKSTQVDPVKMQSETAIIEKPGI